MIFLVHLTPTFIFFLSSITYMPQKYISLMLHSPLWHIWIITKRLSTYWCMYNQHAKQCWQRNVSHWEREMKDERCLECHIPLSNIPEWTWGKWSRLKQCRTLYSYWEVPDSSWNGLRAYMKARCCVNRESLNVELAAHVSGKVCCTLRSDQQCQIEQEESSAERSTWTWTSVNKKTILSVNCRQKEH